MRNYQTDCWFDKLTLWTMAIAVFTDFLLQKVGWISEKVENIVNSIMSVALFNSHRDGALRQQRAKGAFTEMLKDLLAEMDRFKHESRDDLFYNDDIKKFTKSVADIFEEYFLYTNDVVEFYEWMGMNPVRFEQHPFNYTHNFRNFMYVYRDHGEGSLIINKMIRDIRFKLEGEQA